MESPKQRGRPRSIVRRGTRRLGRAALIAALAAASVAARAAPAERPAPATADEVGREFEAICRAIRATDNDFYGEVQVDRIHARLRQPGLTAPERVELQKELADHLLRLGRPEDAVGLLNDTLMLTNQGGFTKSEQILILARLGLAAMRLGEVRNCIGKHHPAMCILPIGREGRHEDPQGSQLAVRAFRAVLDGVPDYPLVPWFLNIAAMTLGQYPDDVAERHRVPPDRLRSSYDIGRFQDVAGAVGLRITDVAGGAVMDDFDGDGLLDVITSSSEPCAPMRRFRNDGRGGFEDLSRSPDMAAQLGILNLLQADFDNDGDVDLLALRGGWLGREGEMRNSLLRNDGERFSDVTVQAGLAPPAYPTQAGGWADYDLDGDLDLYIGNEGRTIDHGHPSQLFRNNGDGTFTDVAAKAGVRNLRYAKGVAWGDADNDGDPDLYVSNYGPNRFYRNNGDGTFTDLAAELGLTEPRGQSFGTWFFDYDNDGWLDLFVTRYEAGPDTISDYFVAGRESPLHPVLYRNLGGAGFAEVGRRLGLTQPSAPMGHNHGDLDNDGFPDFYLGTGWPQYEALMPNLMYRNDAGERFVEVTYSGGFGHLQKGHGVAWGDIDNDGDQDIFEQMGGAFRGDAYPSVLYENPGHGNAWLTLRLEGVTANRSAIGARIEVVVEEGGGERRIHALVGSGGSFGGNSLQAEIGLGAATAVRQVVISWPAGPVQRLGPLAVDAIYEVRENEPPRRLEPTPIALAGGQAADHHGD